MNIKEKIKKLPCSPGVYLMKDSLDNIIYVGKSKNLRSRVGSYFINSKHHSPKVIKLVQNLKNFDFILTDTEFEALLLECKLIKEIKPRYNRLMKSEKNYCYIRIKMDQKYPEIEISNEDNNSDGNLYFGPYTNKNTVEKGLCCIKEHNKILCNNSARKASGCLRYSMNLCMGMCTANPSEAEYFLLVERVIKLLQGSDFTILEEMDEKMNIAASNFDFESAAKYRDYIKAVNYLISAAKILNFTEANKNIAVVEYLSNEEFKFFLIRYNKLLFSERYKLSKSSIDEIKQEIKNRIIAYMGEALESSVNVDKNQIDEAYIIYNYLKSKDSKCKNVVILDKWINDRDSSSIDSVVEKLL